MYRFLSGSASYFPQDGLPAGVIALEYYQLGTVEIKQKTTIQLKRGVGVSNSN